VAAKALGMMDDFALPNLLRGPMLIATSTIVAPFATIRNYNNADRCSTLSLSEISLEFAVTEPGMLKS
jgi:hypothetical protein